MKRFAAWLFAPWRGVTRSGLTPERKAALVGISATVGLLYGGWLLLADKDALNERNALAVILAPDAVPQPKTYLDDFLNSGSPSKSSYVGNRRIDGLRSIRDDVGDSVVRLAAPGGVALAVMIGVSTGFHYLRKTRGEDDI